MLLYKKLLLMTFGTTYVFYNFHRKRTLSVVRFLAPILIQGGVGLKFIKTQEVRRK